MNHFTWIPTRNCIRFFKRTYTLKYKIDYHLVSALSDFGLIENHPFSNHSERSKDIFKVKVEFEIEISGTMDDTYLEITVPKKNPEIIAQIEAKINSWSEIK